MMKKTTKTVVLVAAALLLPGAAVHAQVREAWTDGLTQAFSRASAALQAARASAVALPAHSRSCVAALKESERRLHETVGEPAVIVGTFGGFAVLAPYFGLSAMAVGPIVGVKTLMAAENFVAMPYEQKINLFEQARSGGGVELDQLYKAVSAANPKITRDHFIAILNAANENDLDCAAGPNEFGLLIAMGNVDRSLERLTNASAR